MSISIPQIPFINNPSGYFKRRDERHDGNKRLTRLIKDTRSYVFVPLEDSFEKQNQLNLIRLESQGISGDIEALWSEAHELRQNERREMIDRGFLDDENSRRSLDQAISFRGTCIDMCPVFERIKRTRQNNVNSHEKDPQSGVISRERAIKSFARPAAGQEPPLPSDVRPPSVLLNTLDFMVDHLLDKMPETQSFIWDRTRSIRQDFTFQNYFGPETIECNEKIARIHIMSLHIMANSTIDYSQQQELEQLEKSLKTLAEMYDEYRKKGFPQPPNEAEFRAYHLLLKINDPDLERSCEKLPSKIFKSNFIQIALLFRRLFTFRLLLNSSNLYTTFFDVALSPKVPFLMACLLEVKFNDLRFKALRALLASNHSKSKNVTLLHLFEVLRFPDYKEVKKFLEFHGLKYFADSKGNECVDMSTVPNLYNRNGKTDGAPKVLKSAYDPRINVKMANMTRSQVISDGRRNNFNIESSNIKQFPISANQNIEAIPKANGFLFSNENQKLSMFSGANRGFSFANPMSDLNEIKQQQIEQLEIQRKQEIEKQKQAQKLQEEKIKQEKMKIEFKKQELLRKQKVREEELQRKKEEEFRKQQEIKRQQEEAIRLQEERIRREKEDAARRKRELEIQRFKEEERRYKEALLARKKANAAKLSKDLFECFLNEIVYENVLVTIADRKWEKLLKKHYLKKIVAMARICKENYDEKQRKLDEFYRTQRLFGLTPNIAHITKRIGIVNDVKNNGTLISPTANQSTMIEAIKHRVDSDEKVKNLSKHPDKVDILFSKPAHELTIILPEEEKLRMRQKERDDAIKLWSPLNLSSFVKLCSKNVLLDVLDKKLDISVLISVPSWESPSSKWLKSKFGLSKNNILKTYERTENSSKITVRFTSYHESCLKSTAFLIFECGFNDNHKDYSSGSSAKDKLISDGKLLLQFLDLLDSKSNFKFQLMLLFWKDENLKITELDIYKLLNIDNLKSRFKGNLVDLLFCPLDIKSGDSVAIDKRLSKAILRMAKHFKAALTESGKNAIKLKPVIKPKRIRNPLPTINDTEISNVDDTIAKRSVDYETSIVQQHPYFKRYQFYDQPFLRKQKYLSPNKTTILAPLEVSAIEEGVDDTKKRNITIQGGSTLKRPKVGANNSMNQLRGNSSFYEIPLAHSSMVQGSHDVLLRTKGFRKPFLSRRPNTTMNSHASFNSTYNDSVTNHSFSILNSRFNRISKPNENISEMQNPSKTRNFSNLSFANNSRIENFKRNSPFSLFNLTNATQFSKNGTFKTPLFISNHSNSEAKKPGSTNFTPPSSLKDADGSSLLDLKKLVSSVKSKYSRRD